MTSQPIRATAQPWQTAQALRLAVVPAHLHLEGPYLQQRSG